MPHRSRLAQADMLPLDKAAALTNMTPEAYRMSAKKCQAILIREQGHELVPSWALLDGGVNTLALDIAKSYARQNAYSLSAIEFLNFMQKKITLNFALIDAHLSATSDIKSKFTAFANACEGFQDFNALAMVMSLRDAVTFPTKGSDAQVAKFILGKANTLIKAAVASDLSFPA